MQVALKSNDMRAVAKSEDTDELKLLRAREALQNVNYPEITYQE